MDDILIVKDTLADLKTVIQLLQTAGYQPRIAHNRIAALHQIKIQPPDLILMDIQSPNSEGYRICQEIQAIVHPQIIPAIFVSRVDQTFSKVKAFQSGAVDYITQPYESVELLARIQLHLNHQQLRCNIEQRTSALLAQEQRWQLLLQGTQDGIWEWNHQTQQLTVSAQYQAMLGYEAKSRTGSIEIIQSLLHPEDYQRTASTLSSYLQKQCPVYHIEFRLRCADGSYKWILSRGQGMWDADGTLQQMVGIHQDISDRKQVELELQQARIAAEAANRAKSEFLATMSHELRTPLTAILGFSEMLARASNLQPEQRQNLNTIVHSGKHLLYLMNSILDLAKVESGKVELIHKAFNLQDLLESVVEILRVKTRDQDLKLILDIATAVPKIVKSDEAKLRQVLINLLGNAIKFTAVGKVILRVSSRAENQLRFEVEDSGCGIEADELETIFEVFGQGKAGKASAEGTGLGLAICQRYIELMQGQIQIESTVGIGTTVWFDLPITVVETDSKRQISICSTPLVVQLAPEQSAYRILVAEERSVNRCFLVDILQQAGFDTQEAENGQQAIDLWQKHQPSLILINTQMLPNHGEAIIKQIRCHPSGKGVIILALSANTTEENKNMLLSMGYDDVMTQPIGRQDLLNQIAEHLNVRYVCQSETDQVECSETLDFLTPESFSVMPQPWIEQLHHSASLSSLTQVSQLVSQIPPTHSKLQQQLEGLLSEFRMDKIYQLTQTFLESS
ncbi:MAG: response regulator [Microcoleaceae cyanobacterium]